MQIEIKLLIIFSILFFCSVLLYKYGDKIFFKKREKKEKPKKTKAPNVVKTEGEPTEKQEEQNKSKAVAKKTARPILLSPAPVEPKKLESPKPDSIRHRVIDEDEINEIRKFIDSKPERVEQSSRQGLSDYTRIEEFGDIIDLDEDFDDDFNKDIKSSVGNYNPYINRPQRTGESEFIKNRGEEKSLYEELKNMSPEMKKIIMADILKRKN